MTIYCRYLRLGSIMRMAENTIFPYRFKCIMPFVMAFMFAVFWMNYKTCWINKIPVCRADNIRGAVALWAVAPLGDQPAGRTAAVKAGRKPVHFSLDRCWPFCYFLPVISAWKCNVVTIKIALQGQITFPCENRSLEALICRASKDRKRYFPSPFCRDNSCPPSHNATDKSYHKWAAAYICIRW